MARADKQRSHIQCQNTTGECCAPATTAASAATATAQTSRRIRCPSPAGPSERVLSRELNSTQAVVLAVCVQLWPPGLGVVRVANGSVCNLYLLHRLRSPPPRVPCAPTAC